MLFNQHLPNEPMLSFYLFSCVCIYVHICVRACVYKYTDVCVLIYVCVHMYVYTWACLFFYALPLHFKVFLNKAIYFFFIRILV